jgi:hypothetical protein
MPAQQQQNITIPAPGSMGLNTEQSPTAQDGSFALKADNAVIDQFGRVGSRKAFAELTTIYNLSYSSAIGVVSTQKEVITMATGTIDGDQYVLVLVRVDQYNIGNTVIQSDWALCTMDQNGTDWELNEITTPAFAVPTALSKAKIVSFNDAFYLFSAGNECVVWDGTTAQKLFTGVADTDYIAPQDDAGTFGNGIIDGDIACAAYGRLWVSGVGDDYNVIYFSDLLIGTQWYDGRGTPAEPLNTAGIIDLREYWPEGSDDVRAIVAHNNALFVFGRRSILVWGNPSGDPAAEGGIFLQDAISNIGCVTQDAIAVTGNDVLFVDDTGVRSLGRTIQEKSVPLGDLTQNVRKDISTIIQTTRDKDSISIDYWPEESVSVVTFPEQSMAYVLDMRVPSSTGGSKITRWTNCVHRRSLYVELTTGSMVLLGSNNDQGVLEYRGYQQWNDKAFVFAYASPSLTFGQPANLKFIKQIDYTCVSTFSEGTATARWAWDYESPGRSRSVVVGATPPSRFGVSQYAVDIFGGAVATIKRYKINAKGSGEALIVGIDMNVNGNSFSLQEVNIQTLLGRTL